METLYMYRIVATLIVLIPFGRYCFKFAHKELSENADFFERDTKNKAILLCILIPSMFLGMVLGTILRVDNISFGPKFTFSIIVLAVTIILAIADVILKKHYIKYVSAIVGFLSAIVPTIYFVWALFIDKVAS